MPTQSAACLLIPLYGATPYRTLPGHSLWVVGKAAYVALVLVVTAELALTVRNWTRLLAAVCTLSAALPFPFLLLVGGCRGLWVGGGALDCGRLPRTALRGVLMRGGAYTGERGGDGGPGMGADNHRSPCFCGQCRLCRQSWGKGELHCGKVPRSTVERWVCRPVTQPDATRSCVNTRVRWRLTQPSGTLPPLARVQVWRVELASGYLDEGTAGAADLLFATPGFWLALVAVVGLTAGSR